jgi:hypothetical protein
MNASRRIRTSDLVVNSNAHKTAMLWMHVFKILSGHIIKNCLIPTETRTQNLLFRRQAQYPILPQGHQ